MVGARCNVGTPCVDACSPCPCRGQVRTLPSSQPIDTPRRPASRCHLGQPQVRSLRDALQQGGDAGGRGEADSGRGVVCQRADHGRSLAGEIRGSRGADVNSGDRTRWQSMQALGGGMPITKQERSSCMQQAWDLQLPGCSATSALLGVSQR